ncbi:MAG TPA: hypothetical protein VHJ20_22135 [Polyangia bacterium]|nr:hypothetical protein [Polyangia bacterium]
MKHRLLVVALGLVIILVGAARPAEARLIDLHAGVRAGGVGGWGTTPNTPDFFDRRRGAGAGVDVGVKLLIFDLSANFTQLLDGGTLSQLLFGINIDLPVGNQVFREGIEKGHSRNLLRPLATVGVAAGTPEKVSPPLNEAQISDKGLVTYVGLGYEHFLNEFLGIGAQADFGYHYFVGGGASMAAPSMHGFSAGYNFDGFATLTFHLGY